MRDTLFISVITQPANYLVNPATLTIGASNINRVFDGSAFNLDSVFKPTATSVGFVNGEDFSTLGGVTFAGSAINSTNVGTFTYGVTANGNPNGNYAITYLSPAKLVTSSVDGNSQQPDPFVNPVTPKPIPPIDTTSTTGSSANAGSFQLARNVRLYAPDQCSDNTGLEAGLEADINNENCECQKALFNDESLCRIVAEESGPEFLSAVTSIERANTN